MITFKYKVMNKEGEKIEGKYEANSENEVMDFLSTNGYYPLKIEEMSSGVNIEFDFSRKVKLKDLAVFCRQFYTMLTAGVPIIRCLEILSVQIENKKLRKATREVSEEVEKGEVLSEAMKKHQDVFPELLVSLVASGEASGNLDAIMLRMSTHYEKDSKINSKVKSAFIYPIVLGIASIGAVTFILVYVMPTFIAIFNQTGTVLPWSTKLLLGISEGIKNDWILIIIFMIIAIAVLKIFLKTERGLLIWGTLKLKLPILKKLNKMIIISRFTRTLSTLISSGLTLVEALEIVSTVVGNRAAEKTLLKIRDDVVRGESLNTSMRESEMFTEMLYAMVQIGEETGMLDDILNKTADFYDDELETVIQASVALLEPILIIIMGLVIGFMVGSIVLPMFDSYGQI